MSTAFSHFIIAQALDTSEVSGFSANCERDKCDGLSLASSKGTKDAAKTNSREISRVDEARAFDILRDWCILEKKKNWKRISFTWSHLRIESLARNVLRGLSSFVTDIVTATTMFLPLPPPIMETIGNGMECSTMRKQSSFQVSRSFLR